MGIENPTKENLKVAALEKALDDLCKLTSRIWAYGADGTILVEMDRKVMTHTRPPPNPPWD